MSYFVEYAPESNRHQETPPKITIRFATQNDAAAMAQIETERRGNVEDYPQTLEKWQKKLLNKQALNQIFVATINENHQELVVGWSVIEFRDLSEIRDPATNQKYTAPTAWYLLGLGVFEKFRRLRIGTLLTQARIDWAKSIRPDEKILYYTNPQNITSMAFHELLKFQKIEEKLTFPGRDVDRTIYFSLEKKE